MPSNIYAQFKSVEEMAGETRIPIPDDLCPDPRGCRFQYLDVCVPLYQAAMQGNWKAANKIVSEYPNAVRIPITTNGETALHIAAAAKRTSFVKKLVKKMNTEDLKKENKYGYTALCYAAISGVVKIAVTMVETNKNLPNNRGHVGVTPLYFAVKLGHKNMVSYLYELTKVEEMTPTEKIQLFFTSIYSDMYDVALKLLQKDPTLAIARNSELEDTALHVLARKPQVFARESLLVSMGRLISSWICKKGTKTQAQEFTQNLWRQVLHLQESEISKLIERPSNLLLDAAEIGNVGFLTLLHHSYPDLLWKGDDKRGTIFHVAVEQRQEKVFSLIHEIGAIKDILAFASVEEQKNTMLHLAAELPPPSRLNVVSGPALQMQRELLWFKEVEKIVPLSVLSSKNINPQIPREQFTKNHQKLVKEGEKWMKETATSCMVVAALIATVVFTAAFTVPGGNNSETGRPMFLKEHWFLVFILSDVMSLFSSIISIVMFLSILTSRYAEDDFLVLLPAKLIVGLAALFFAIASMLLAFFATFVLVYNNVMSCVPIVVALLALLATICHFGLHFEVWIVTIGSTCFSKFLFKNFINKLF